eukprot:Skav223586  [mRNA]  locus=scaffold689:194848:199374:+ [translate_table: standard]
MSVMESHRIEDHTPLFVDLILSDKPEDYMTMVTPKSWATLSPKADCIDKGYISPIDNGKIDMDTLSSPMACQQALIKWSKSVENAVHHALKMENMMDPIRQPHKGLSSAFRGRCQTKIQQHRAPMSVPMGKHGGYNPPCEIVGIKSKQKTRQVRRISSLLRAMSSRNANHACPKLLHEWTVIRKAAGYGNRWDHWILAFEPISHIPCGLPDCDMVNTMLQITKTDCDMFCNQEFYQRRKFFEYKIKIDIQDNFSKGSYAILRKKEQSILHEVPCVREAQADLVRSRKSQPTVRIRSDVRFHLDHAATFGDTSVRIDKCPFCGDVDNRAHQILHCPHFADVRARHNDAMHVLDQERPTWVYIPVALEHDEVRILRRIMQSIQPVPPAPPLPLPQGKQLTTFFTDGGAIHPRDVGARLAAFAVVQDVRSNVTQFHQQNLTDSFPDFRVITSGLVGGSQTTARGELMAFLRALQAAVQLDSEIRVDFVTDAKYVWDLVLHILDPNNNVIEINTSNVDIIEQIVPLWQHPRFQLRKVKSHRSIESAKDSADLYDILGNAVVDKAVTAVLQFAHKDLIAMANRIAAFHHEEQARLKSVAEFFLDLNRTRLKMIEQNKVQSSPGTIVQIRSLQAVMPSKIMGDDAVSFLASYKPEGHTQFATDEIPDMECFLACQQGAKLGMAVVFWLQSLLWPSDVQQKTDDASDWGISWLELFFDFHISTAMTFPIRVEGLKKQAKYVEFSSQEASLLPPQKRSPANQAFCLQKMISTIETISGLQFIPKFKSHKCSSLNHVNLQGKTTGIPRRPTLKHPDLTIQAVSEYFALCHGKLVQGHAFHCFTGQPSIDIPEVVDLPTDERCRLYQRLMKRASRLRASGG